MSPRISGVWHAPTRRWGVKVLSAILARPDANRPKARFDQLRRAPEPDDAYFDAPIHPPDQRILENAGESRGDGGALLHVLQFRPRASKRSAWRLRWKTGLQTTSGQSRTLSDFWECNQWLRATCDTSSIRTNWPSLKPTARCGFPWSRNWEVPTTGIFCPAKVPATWRSRCSRSLRFRPMKGIERRRHPIWSVRQRFGISTKRNASSATSVRSFVQFSDDLQTDPLPAALTRLLKPLLE